MAFPKDAQNDNETEELEQENEDGTQDEEHEEDAEHEPVQGDEQDSNGKGKNRKVGEGTSEDEDELGEEDEEVEDVEEEAEDPEKEELRQRLAKLEEAQKKPVAEQKELSDDDKARIADKAGFADYKSVEFINNSLAGALMAVKNYIDGQMGGFKKGSLLQDFSKKQGFQDAESYKPGIDEYFEKVAKGQQPDPQTMEAAYYYAKGKGTKKAMVKIMNSKERNRKIGGTNRPASTNSKGSKQNKSSVKLTSIQRSAAKAVNMSEREYAELLGQRG